MCKICKRGTLTAFILALGVVLASCDVSEGDDMRTKKRSANDEVFNSASFLNAIVPANYTNEALDAKILVTDCFASTYGGYAGNWEDKTLSAEDLQTVNLLLGYVESVIDAEDYFLWSYRGGENGEGSVTFVLKKYVAELERPQGDNGYDNTIIHVYIKRNESSSRRSGQLIMQSTLEPYLMARRWTADLKADFAREFPAYHINTFYIELDNIVPEAAYENYEQFDDYHYFYDGHSNLYGNRRFNNSVNILLPVGTPSEEIDGIFEEVRPLLQEYKVSEVTFVVFADEESLEKTRNEETITGNKCSFLDVDLNISIIENYGVRNSR
jgi:hypothetical protein